MTRGIRYSAAMGLAIGCGLCGCNRGPVPTYPASGKVVFADKAPLTGGNIEFSPKAGEVRSSARAMINEDGTFTLTTFHEGDGAIEGVHQVLIIPARRRGQRGDVAERTIDGKYQSFDTSGLEADVRPDSANEFEFVVSPSGGN